MADAGIKIEIVSPEHLVLSDTVQSVTVPGQEGYFTVMGDHAPLMTNLKPGFVTVVKDGSQQTYFVRGGFADVSPDGLTILAEEAKTGADFDQAEIETAITEAQTALDAATDLAARDVATATLDGWKNLMIDAAQAAGVTTH